MEPFAFGALLLANEPRSGRRARLTASMRRGHVHVPGARVRTEVAVSAGRAVLREIDRQRARIFSLSREFHLCVSRGRERKQAVAILRTVIERVCAAFELEQSVLEQIAHPTLSEQCQLHESLINELRASEELLDSGGVLALSATHALDTLLVYYCANDAFIER